MSQKRKIKHPKMGVPASFSGLYNPFQQIVLVRPLDGAFYFPMSDFARGLECERQNVIPYLMSVLHAVAHGDAQ